LYRDVRVCILYKGKVHSIKGNEGPEVEKSCSFTLSLTLALYGVGGQRHDPAVLPPGKTQYPLYVYCIYSTYIIYRFICPL